MWNAALALQKHFRAMKIRKWFTKYRKAVEIRNRAEDVYLANPKDIVARVNYAFYTHSVSCDYDRARRLWVGIVEYMTQRGPDNALVLYGYGLYLASTMEEDFSTIEAIIERAKVKDPNGRKFEAAELGFYRKVRLRAVLLKVCEEKIESFFPDSLSSSLLFFSFNLSVPCLVSQAVTEMPKKGAVLLHYALVMELIHHDYDTAELYYKRVGCASCWTCFASLTAFSLPLRRHSSMMRTTCL